MRVIGYVRIAPRERPSSRPGLDAQRRAVREECRRRGLELVRFEQDVRSGRTMRRPGLTAALEACRSGEADGILVARLDRLTYSIEDLGRLMAEALRHRFTVIAPDLGIDLATVEGRHLATVLGAASTWNPRILSGRTHRALDAARPRGRPQSTPPALADRIRTLRLEGWTLQAICDRLNAEGTPTPRGGTRWRPTSLRAILRPLSEKEIEP